MDKTILTLLPEDYVPFDVCDTEGSIVDRFKKTVAQYPERLAIRGTEEPERDITYEELDQFTDYLSCEILDTLGTTPAPIVLFFNIGHLAYIAQLSVLKSNKFYVCLDCQRNIDDLSEIIKTLNSPMILCENEYFHLALSVQANAAKITIKNLTTLNFEFAPIHRALSPFRVLSDSPAYITYTSGSTGAAEAVVVSHRSILHFTMNNTNCTHVTKADRCVQLCPLYSAASASEIFPVLLNGAVLLPFSIQKRGLLNFPFWLRYQRITLYTSVPTVFRLAFQHLNESETFPDLRLIRLGGDRVLQTDIEIFRKHFTSKCLLRVTLGAAECLSFAHYFVHHDSKITAGVVPAGYVLNGMTVAIVDENVNVVKDGEIGEIAVSSRYLSEGYWANPELTAQRFLRISGKDENCRTYLTRDMGYVDDDGCLHHMGRKDFQVKIFGKMVSLSETESLILQMPEILDAVVLADYAETETALVAFYVGRSDAEIDDMAIREFLYSRLRPEKTPKKYIRLASMPVTRNNKVDRRKLESTLVNIKTSSS